MDPGGGASNSPSVTLDKTPGTSPGKSTLQKTPITLKLSSKGVENAKKRLRAFSIQKKTPITPIVKPKPSGSGNTTVVIGKLSSVKVTPKPDKVEDPDVKKPPKPPKPGTTRKAYQDSYSDLQKRTLAEIEDMKRKMELVDLGIPLGLIYPTSTSEKAMPTKAMPPIKSFLDPEKLNKIIREAKKAKEEGRQFKFDYHKLLPDYDNPFQRKKEEVSEKERSYDRRKSEVKPETPTHKERKSDKYDSKRHVDYRRDDKNKYRFKEKSRSKDEPKKNTEKSSDKETDVNLNDYLVCDSWSLDNEDKNNSSSPKVDDKQPVTDAKLSTELSDIAKISLAKKNELLKTCALDSPKPKKIEKLQPVMDSFKYEIDSNDEEILDIFDEESDLEKYAHLKTKKTRSTSPVNNIELDHDVSRDESLNDDTFLESIIDEIKQEELSGDEMNEKGLVEYDISPPKDDTPMKRKRGSGTPEIDERVRTQSERSDYSGYISTDSYRTTDTSESGYKSVESYRMSVEKELDEALNERLSKSTVDSLETWSFVLKICQPLLFRHDKNKCYKETRTVPKLWYTENPKTCKCVKDRVVVYEELEMCKMNLVDRVYGCDQIPDSACPNSRGWYPRNALCPTDSSTVSLSNEWEADDSQQDSKGGRRSTTPLRNEEISLDREYQRFMQAVWPDVSESKVESSRSTTPVRQEKKKKNNDAEKYTDDKKGKKIKLTSEGWSQESDVEEDIEKSKKLKEKEKAKLRKRKHSTSTLSSSLSDSEDSRKKSKAIKKKALKKVKSKSAKRRRIGRKILKKLKDTQKKKKKSKSSEDDDIEDSKKDKKSKRKKQIKLKKKTTKKKKVKAKSSSSSDSSSSSSDSESDSESDRHSKKAKKKSQVIKKKKKSKKRKQSFSDSSQSEELFDVNILNNIKTERLTDDEFSPRRQKPREIINVKELQNDFVGNNIQIKQEVVDEIVPEEPVKKVNLEISKVEKSERKEMEQVSVDAKRDEVEQSALIAPLESVEFPKPVKQPTPVEAPTPVDSPMPVEPPAVEVTKEEIGEVKKPAAMIKPVVDIKTLPEDSNMSQSSSQESVCSIKEAPTYEKDESYLRPSSQNSNYCFNDVITASQGDLYSKHMDVVPACEEKYSDGYEAGNYEMYEQLAMTYDNDVSSQSPQRIETVVRARSCGEIKCDWRPGAAPAPPPTSRRSRWGLKPGEVNIVLTGGSEHDEPTSPQVFPIQSLANRAETNTGYDEAYLDMYGASDRLQYGDCFSSGSPAPATTSANITVTTHKTDKMTLDDRIDQVLRESVLGEVTKEEEAEVDKESPEKGILVTAVVSDATRALKRVSFADGYKPGQDSDVEEPPIKKPRKKVRRMGCAWPCPASHPDHVPLWDALPPPPPPPGSPPPRGLAVHEPMVSTGGFLPPEPPPGLIALHV